MRLLLPLTLAALTCSCIADFSADRKVMPSVGAMDKDGKLDKDQAEKLDELTEEIAEAEHDLQVAQWDSEVLEMKFASDNTESHESQESAQRSLTRAEQAVVHFREVEAPHRIAEKELQLEGQQDRLWESEKEKAELTSAYEDDPIGARGREIVLERMDRALERSRKSFQLNQAELTDLKSNTLPREEAKLQESVLKARQDLASELRKAQAMSLEQQSKHASAKFDLGKAQRGLQKKMDEKAKAEAQ